MSAPVPERSFCFASRWPSGQSGRMTRCLKRFTGWVLVLAGLLPGGIRAAEAAAKKPVLLYSRYFNAVGETRYLPDGSYKDVLEKLRADFEVRVHAEPLNRRT